MHLEMTRLIGLAIVLLATISDAGAADELKIITNERELNYFAQTYYQHPRPDLVESAIKYVDSSGLALDKSAKAPLLMCFSCIFSVTEGKITSEWRNIIASLSKETKELLMRSIDNSPQKLLDQVHISPAKNDMNWACFFATGDLKYLNGIIKTLKYLDERNDINLFLTAASAKWSLSSNAKTHEKVRLAIEAMRVGDIEEMRPLAVDILAESPQQIKDETIAILKEQREKGIWN